jgi:uncharacterized protein YllA (UPF0747 family)
VTLSFRVQEFDFAALPQFGEAYPMAQVASWGTGKLGIPLFTPEQAGHVSDSPFLDRKAVAAHIAGRNPGLPSPPEEARYVVAGQQAGLLTGPLYTFLKAVTAVALAKKLSSQADRPVLPLFWTASEDHDVVEVNRVCVNGKWFVHRYAGEIRRGKVPQVADISVRDAREPLLEFLRESLPGTEFRPWVLDMVASADYSSYATAFEGLLRAMFAEWNLRVVDPIGLRPLTGPALAALAGKWPEVTAALERGSERLSSASLPPPLELAAIFEVWKEGRRRLEDVPSPEEIGRRPEAFSPNAALRPVVQDAALPVVATVAGPSEVLYLWQIRSIHDVIGATPSLIAPRISATFVEEKIQKAAEKAGLGAESLFGARSSLQDHVSEIMGDPDLAVVEQHAQALIKAVEETAGAKTPAWLEKRKKSLRAQVEKLVDRMREDRISRSDRTRGRLQKTADALIPEGKPQERVANVLQFLNLYGPEFTAGAVESLDPLSDRHQVAWLAASGREE